MIISVGHNIFYEGLTVLWHLMILYSHDGGHFLLQLYFIFPRGFIFIIIMDNQGKT